jgi:hypothetical protein
VAETNSMMLTCNRCSSYLQKLVFQGRVPRQRCLVCGFECQAETDSHRNFERMTSSLPEESTGRVRRQPGCSFLLLLLVNLMLLFALTQ